MNTTTTTYRIDVTEFRNGDRWTGFAIAINADTREDVQAEAMRYLMRNARTQNANSGKTVLSENPADYSLGKIRKARKQLATN